MNSIIKYNIERLLFYICIVDLLFLPYIRLLSIKAFMIIVVLWYSFGGIKKIYNQDTLKRFYLFAFFSFGSVLLGLLFNNQYLSLQYLLLGNIQIIVIVWFAYLCLYYFKYHFTKYDTKLENFMYFYLFFALVTVILYWQNPQLFYNIRRYWTLGNENITFIHSTYTRYMHIASEPNNFSAMIIGIMTYLRYVENIDKVKMNFVYVVCFIIVITTMSTTGILMFGAVVTVDFITKKRFITKFKIKNILYWILSTIILLLSVIYFRDNIVAFFRSDIFNAATLRYNVYLDDGNISGSRFGIWVNILKEINILWYIIIGRGTVIVSEGIQYKPHSGHLMLIYGYGMIAYGLFMYEFFWWKKGMEYKKYLAVILPFFIIFTMNTMIGDLRAVFLFVLLLSVISSKKSIRKDIR